ncbi:alpha-2,8-sialyltransferase 8B-like [Lytechinus variegatus]|uniref:alpha-2,8-sialyltransferase 8B-like n=1 Tax=Lytechinus variegatus TaxID=7654 RepID=UPI001BB12B56|nr:alpha-2,8-sialyltransferase 8B-like [Lytechinus variegatus]
MIFVRSIDYKVITCIGVTVSLMVYMYIGMIWNDGPLVLLSYHMDAIPYRRAPIFVKSTLNNTVIQMLRKKVGKKLKSKKPIQIFHSTVNLQDIKVNKTSESEISERAKSCALVGNSGILLNSGCGDLIDESELVVRMNLAKIGQEYSSDVGSKVSYMTINWEQLGRLKSCFTKKKKRKASSASELLKRLPAVCGTMIDRLGLLSNDTVLWPSRGHADMIFRVLPLLRKQFHLNFSLGINSHSLKDAAYRLWHLRAPSSGLTVLAPMIQLCDEISLFGFYPFYTDPYNRTILHHYYDPEARMNYTTNFHNMPGEYRFLLDLENKGAIRIINNCTPTY